MQASSARGCPLQGLLLAPGGTLILNMSNPGLLVNAHTPLPLLSMPEAALWLCVNGTAIMAWYAFISGSGGHGVTELSYGMVHAWLGLSRCMHQLSVCIR